MNTSLRGDELESSCAVFRNARADSETEASQEYLYGIAKDDEPGNVFWSGGSQQVILRKVSDKNVPLKGAELTVYAGRSNEPYVVKTKVGETVRTEVLKDLESGPSGVFWGGTLPYGAYYLHETQAPSKPVQYEGNKWFILTVSEKDGVSSAGPFDSDPRLASTGT